MPQPDSKLTILATAAAWYAAIVSTATAAVQFANFLRDRKKVSLALSRHMAVPGDPNRAGITFTILRVANAGRRPLTIAGAYYYNLGNAGALLTDTSPGLPHELTEGPLARLLKNPEPNPCRM